MNMVCSCTSTQLTVDSPSRSLSTEKSSKIPTPLAKGMARVPRMISRIL